VVVVVVVVVELHEVTPTEVVAPEEEETIKAKAILVADPRTEVETEVVFVAIEAGSVVMEVVSRWPSDLDKKKKASICKDSSTM